MRHQRSWFEIVLAVAFLSATIFAAFSDAYNLPNRWFIRDDAYYYFKVAQNISEGRGSTFDGLNRSNGYHPLWMMVCIPIFALTQFDVIPQKAQQIMLVGSQPVRITCGDFFEGIGASFGREDWNHATLQTGR